jgi:glycosyltransferase involved in cell wall biosynthesis
LLILHLSHTDIRYDSRILKELDSLERLDTYDLVGIGVSKIEGAPNQESDIKAKIITVDLVTKRLKFLPRALRYSINMIELTTRFLIMGIRLKPSVVHCHDTLVLPVGVLIKLFTNCKLVYDAHELESNKNAQTKVMSFGTLFIEKHCWGYIDLLITVSESILDWYQVNLGKKKGILVLNAPKIETFFHEEGGRYGNSTKYFNSLYGFPEDKLVFVYLGIFGKGRGIEMIMDVFGTRNIDAHVVFVGYGELVNLIESYSKIFSNIHCHSPVPHEQVVKLISSADVGLCLVENVSLSDYYCLPNKLFEYCFAGLHVLGSDFPEIRKLIERYSLGACCSLDHESIFSAISKIIEIKPERRTGLISELSWDAQADRLRHAYREMIIS